MLTAAYARDVSIQGERLGDSPQKQGRGHPSAQIVKLAMGARLTGSGVFFGVTVQVKPKTFRRKRFPTP